MTKSKVEQAKLMIIQSPDANDIAKQVLLFLINHSENFTQSVCFTVHEKFSGWTKSDIKVVQDGIHDMNSAGNQTNLFRAFEMLNTPLHFSHAAGAYEKNSFSKTTPGLTVWLSSKDYDDDAERLTPLKSATIRIPLTSELSEATTITNE